MVQQIVIEAEPPGGARSMFRLSIDANLIAKGATMALASFALALRADRGSAPARGGRTAGSSGKFPDNSGHDAFKCGGTHATPSCIVN